MISPMQKRITINKYKSFHCVLILADLKSNINLVKIILKGHLELRLVERQIPLDYPEKVILKPDHKFFDSQSLHEVAIKYLQYKDKLRPMMVAYDIIGQEFQIITIHPITDQEIKNKLERGRWIKNEES